MAHNVVRDWSKDKILYRTRRGLGAACEWMMLHIDSLDIENTSADEILEDGELGGSWFLSDLFENNPAGWEMDDGTIIICARSDDGTWHVIKTKEV